jgi:hypothetical protein
VSVPPYPTSRVALSRKRIVIKTALATHHWQIASILKISM